MTCCPRFLLRLLLGLTLLTGSAQAAFDHSHTAWTTLLQKHVVEQQGGAVTAVRYTAFAQDRSALKTYLAKLSAVNKAEYDQFSKPEQLAFLINSYNAYTVELILSRYPNLKSIRDLGSIISSPWKKKFVPLVGSTVSLDEIEHGMIRAKGVFNDPRIHAAVNCASIGCPALRNEAFIAPRLDAQLDDSLSKFMADRTRNRFDAARGVMEVSSIFDWYGKDFEQGHKGYDSLKTLFSRHAAQLAGDAAAQARIQSGDYKVKFLDYDWKLNDAR